MQRTGDNLPTGFLGPVNGWQSLLPAAQRAFRWPLQCGDEAPADSGNFDLVEVKALTESLGRVEDALGRFADQLCDGGTLLCDFDNLQSARMLRMVVEGRPGSFDPAGSSSDPTQALSLRRVLAATANAGLLVRDVLRVPSGAEEFKSSLVRDLIGNGLLPIDWLDGAPPARFWLQCQKSKQLAGSVIIAGGSDAERARTQRAVEDFLPADWEIVSGSGVGECAQWNRAIAAASGEVVWFLRAGTEPTEAVFAALSARAGVGLVVPGTDEQRAAPGDISGSMLPRLDLLFVGPLPEHMSNSQVALEEYVMRLDSKLPAPWMIDIDLPMPKPSVEQPESFAADAADLVERWSVVDGDEIATSAPKAGTPPAPWTGRMPRVSLCMITRDEEGFLPESLAAAKAAVDEIVVVDTGSTDRTVEIAKSFGAKVLLFPWEDDFSGPRNAALSAATGDWVLVLDADEFVQGDGCERIRELVQSPSVLGYYLRFVNAHGSNKTNGVMMVRLFRNLPGIEYQNIIHEQVTPSLQRLGHPLGLTLKSADIEVEHRGYEHEVMERRGKNERNERLFKKQIAQMPEDIYSHYKYGDFLRRVPGRGEDAKRFLDRCLELITAAAPTLPREFPYAGEVAALCALEAERMGEHERAREVLDFALRRFIPTPNLHYMAASLALADERSEIAIAHFRRCMTYRGRVLVVPIQDGITSYVSLTGIAQAWLLRGEIDRAERLLQQAISIQPDYEVAQLALSRLWIQRGDMGRALHVLTEFLGDYPDSPGAAQQTMLILQRLGKTDAAKQMGVHTVRLLQARALDREAAAVHELLATL